MHKLLMFPSAVLLAGILMCPLSVLADEPTVANQLYDLGGKVEVMLTQGFSAFDKYTSHIGTSVGVAYYFNDYIGVEIDGGYNYIAGDRKLLDAIVTEGIDTLDGDVDDDTDDVNRLALTDLKYLQWWTTGGVILNPLYGKLNLSSEFAVNIHL